ELTDLAGFHVATFRVNDAQLVLEGTRSGLPRTSDTAGFHARGRALGAAERILTHAVPGQDANAEARLELIALRRRRSGRGVDRAQRRFDPGALRLCRQELQHRADHVDRGHAERVRVVPEGRRVEL